MRLTYKVNGRTVSESLPDADALRAARRQIAEFRKFQRLSRELLEINVKICQLLSQRQRVATKPARPASHMY
jgi:hypothetical protein